MMARQECCNCGSTDIKKDSSCMGFHECNACGSTDIMWTEGDDECDNDPSPEEIDNLIRREIKLENDRLKYGWW